MSPLKYLTTKVSIDGLGISCCKNSGQDVFAGDVIGEYKKFDNWNLEAHQPTNKSGTIDRRGWNYKWLLKYKHGNSGNILNVYTQKIRNQNYVPSIYANFLSSYDNPLESIDVMHALEDLCGKELNDFHISKIHLATDLIVPNSSRLHKRVCRSINPLKKRQITVYEGSSDTLYLGSSKSPHQVVVYDKGEELKEKKGRLIEEDISRIEVRMKLSMLKNRINTLEQLRSEGWASFIYGKFFSLDRPRHALKTLIGKRAARLPLHKIKDLMREQEGNLPDNFHRDYIREHRIFGPAVRKALASYKWD